MSRSMSAFNLSSGCPVVFSYISVSSFFQRSSSFALISTSVACPDAPPSGWFESPRGDGTSLARADVHIFGGAERVLARHEAVADAGDRRLALLRKRRLRRDGRSEQREDACDVSSLAQGQNLFRHLYCKSGRIVVGAARRPGGACAAERHRMQVLIAAIIAGSMLPPPSACSSRCPAREPRWALRCARRCWMPPISRRSQDRTKSAEPTAHQQVRIAGATPPGLNPEKNRISLDPHAVLTGCEKSFRQTGHIRLGSGGLSSSWSGSSVTIAVAMAPGSTAQGSGRAWNPG